MARQLRKTRRNAKARRGTRKGGKRKIVKRQRVMRKKRGTKRRQRGGLNTDSIIIIKNLESDSVFESYGIRNNNLGIVLKKVNNPYTAQNDTTAQKYWSVEVITEDNCIKEVRLPESVLNPLSADDVVVQVRLGKIPESVLIDYLSADDVMDAQVARDLVLKCKESLPKCTK